VTHTSNTELEDITLSVYWYVVKQGRPVGPRDAMKGAHLSSPSVAYRHLQKLEDLGLLQKNEYGEYMVKQKVNMHGYVWIGKRFISKMLLYALIFMTILSVEIFILVWHWAVEDYKFKVFFSLLILITGSAMSLFIIEGFLQRKRVRQSLHNLSPGKEKN
jgi:hypothetical protein